jgi:hypothetical protein
MNKKNLALGNRRRGRRDRRVEIADARGRSNWEKVADKVHHANIRISSKLTARPFITRNSAKRRIRRCF